MFELLWLIPAVPLAGFLVLVGAGARFSRAGIAAIGVGSVGIAAVLASWAGIRFVLSPPPEHAFTQVLWTWMQVGSFSPEIAFRLDALSVTMILVVTIVGFFIHLYSAEYMADDEDYSRFFAYMNLFVASMLTLVLADNLLFLYLGWEGVGLCSYLLIGFWYRDRENARAAIKAFVVTRIGDTGMAVGLVLLFVTLGTFQIQELMHRASVQWVGGSPLAIAAAALLLCGALGKSAQVPLQTWLPDAMAGPTPVSALIHAATMVTAGVYLIARTNVLFTLAPPIQTAVAVIGAITLLIAGFSALTQQDIKRVLAYSTISQIGYMFLALGVGAWAAGIFHFVTHAFFKSLLFLGAGAVLACTHHERNMMRLGGLRSELPWTFWTFLVGAASLAALPLVTAGFYSKDLILWSAWASPKGSAWLWLGGVVGALVTGLYAFRMVFLTFLGSAKTPVTHRPGTAIRIPLVILAISSVAVGFLETPETLGGIKAMSHFLQSVLPASPVPAGMHGEPLNAVVGGLACFAGVLVAYFLYIVRPHSARKLGESDAGATLHRFWFAGWGFDRLYDTLFVRPFVWIARTNRDDVVDLVVRAIAGLNELAHVSLTLTQTGRIRQYAMGIGLGALIALWIVVFV